MVRSFFFSSIVLVPMLFLAACGVGARPSNSINVTMTDFMFSPNTFSVPTGGQISFKASNNGAVAHSFIIMKLGQKVQAHFSDADKVNIFWQATQIAPGQSVTDSFTAPNDPGEYQIVCGEAGHFETGMVGKLIVVK